MVLVANLGTNLWVGCHYGKIRGSGNCIGSNVMLCYPWLKMHRFLWLAQWGVNIFLPHFEWPEKFWPVYKSWQVFCRDFQELIGQLINWKIQYYVITFLTFCNSVVVFFFFVMPIRLKVAWELVVFLVREFGLMGRNLLVLQSCNALGRSTSVLQRIALF